MIVALDGPAGSGKSTASKQLARELGFLYLDTGAMYRSIGYLTKEAGIALEQVHAQAEKIAHIAKAAHIEMKPSNNPQDLIHVWCNGEDVKTKIRTRDIDAYASAVATLPQVREALVQKQQEIARSQNVVLEGRDTTTVVCPEAQVKVYLEASAASRAFRRTLEDYPKFSHLAKEDVENSREYFGILKEIEERDYQDMHREVSPLTKAHDAHVIDSSDCSIDDVVTQLKALVQSAEKDAHETV